MKLTTLSLALAPIAALARHHQIPLPPLSPNHPPPAGPLPGIPILGISTGNMHPSTAAAAVSWAIQMGYTHIDCAAAAGNEAAVGRGIATGLRRTRKTRADLWITSKLWNDHHAPDRVAAALNRSLTELGVGYLDLYHMHWPVGSDDGVHRIDYLATWDAMTRAVDSGAVRHLGVSNFSPRQMETLLNHTRHAPAVHQMELHPYLPQPAWLEWHRRHHIHVTAYSPLADTNPVYDTSPSPHPPLLRHPTLHAIAAHRACTPAQVAIMWALARGTSTIPEAETREHVWENFHSLACVLQAEDLESLDQLVGEDPVRFSDPGRDWGVPLFEGLEDGDLSGHPKGEL